MKSKQKIYLSLGGFALLCLLLIVFAIFPFFLEIQENSETLVLQKQDLAHLEAEIEGLARFKIHYQEIQAELGRTDSLFADSEAPVDFIAYLEKNARDCNISMEILSASAKEDLKDFWPSFSFSISSSGSLPNFLQFIEKLETGPYLLEIQSLKIRELTQNELKSEEFSSEDIKMDLLIKVYKHEKIETN